MTTQLIEGGVQVDTDADADAALEPLYDAHYVRLVRLAVLLLGDVGRAEEVVQDSFVAIYRAGTGCRRRRPGVPPHDGGQPLTLSAAPPHRRRRHPADAPLDEPGADDDVLRGVRRGAVIDAMAGLPRRQREVLALRYYLDLSEREIAETLGISPGAVKSHASRGAAALRRTLSPLLEETS